MKKTISVLLALCLLFTLAACSSGGETTPADSSAPADTAADTTTAPADATKASSDPATAPSEAQEVHETISPAIPYPDGDDYYEFDCSADLTENGYYKNVKSEDYVTLPQSMSISIPYATHTPSDDDMKEAIDNVIDFYATEEQILDRAVADGDTINIDYVGSLDGVEFEGGSTYGYGTTVTVGVTNYVDDFLQKLIGHKPGETFDINIKFPDNYGNASLAGQDTVFNVTINYIVGEKIMPELTDEFVAENLQANYGWTTVEEMKAGIAADLSATAINDYVYDYLINNSQVKEVPQELIDYMSNYFIYYHSYLAQGYEVTIPVLLSSYGFSSMADMLADYKADIEAACREEMIIQAAAKSLNVELTTEDLEAYFMEELGRTDYSLYETNFGLPYVKKMVLSWKVLQVMKEQATYLQQ